MLKYKYTAHFGDASPQRHSSDGFMLNNGTIFDNKNFHQKSGPGWIQRAETQNFAEVQNDEDKPADWAATTATQLSWCPQITRTLHSFSESVFRNPTHHHTITTWREKLPTRTCGISIFYITDISTVWGYPTTILCYQGTLAPHLRPLYSSLSFRKYPWRLFASEDGRSWPGCLGGALQ